MSQPVLRTTGNAELVVAVPIAVVIFDVVLNGASLPLAASPIQT